MRSVRLLGSKLEYLSKDLLQNGSFGAYVARRNYGSAYDAEGKTYGKIVNKGKTDVLLIDAITERGFRLTNSIHILGPTIIFPHAVLSWNVESAADINEDSLSLFKIMEPKVDMLIIGYGESKDYGRDIQLNVFKACRSLKLNFEAMTTDNAVSTFNFLSHDRRLVAAALIPPIELTFFGMGADVNRDHVLEIDIDENNRIGNPRIPRPETKIDRKDIVVGSGTG